MIGPDRERRETECHDLVVRGHRQRLAGNRDAVEIDQRDIRRVHRRGVDGFRERHGNRTGELTEDRALGHRFTEDLQRPRIRHQLQRHRRRKPDIPPRVHRLGLHRDRRAAIAGDRRHDGAEVEREGDGIGRDGAVNQQRHAAHLHVVGGGHADTDRLAFVDLRARQRRIDVRGRRGDRDGGRDPGGVGRQVIDDLKAGGAVGDKPFAGADRDTERGGGQLESRRELPGIAGIGHVEQIDDVMHAGGRRPLLNRLHREADPGAVQRQCPAGDRRIIDTVNEFRRGGVADIDGHIIARECLVARGDIGDAVGDRQPVTAGRQRQRAGLGNRAGGKVEHPQRMRGIHRIQRHALKREAGDRGPARAQDLEQGPGGDVEGVDGAAAVGISDTALNNDRGRGGRGGLQYRRRCNDADIHKMQRTASRDDGDAGRQIDRDAGRIAAQFELADDSGGKGIADIDDREAVTAGRDERERRLIRAQCPRDRDRLGRAVQRQRRDDPGGARQHRAVVQTVLQRGEIGDARHQIAGLRVVHADHERLGRGQPIGAWRAGIDRQPRERNVRRLAGGATGELGLRDRIGRRIVE